MGEFFERIASPRVWRRMMNIACAGSVAPLPCLLGTDNLAAAGGQDFRGGFFVVSFRLTIRVARKACLAASLRHMSCWAGKVFWIPALSSMRWACCCWHTAGSLQSAITRRPAHHRPAHEADMPHVLCHVCGHRRHHRGCGTRIGTVVGVVVFGIGGLIRFRSATNSTRDTVRLIIVTLSGLIAGLGLWHFAVHHHRLCLRPDLAVRHQSALPYPHRGPAKGRTLDCAQAYRLILKQHGCSIISEHHSARRNVSNSSFACRAAATARRWKRSFSPSPPICAGMWTGKSAKVHLRSGSEADIQPQFAQCPLGANSGH